MNKNVVYLIMILLLTTMVYAVPPIITNIQVTSPTGNFFSLENLTCAVNAIDLDNDTITTRYEWFEGGSRLGECQALIATSTCDPTWSTNFPPNPVVPPEASNIQFSDNDFPDCPVGSNCFNGFDNATIVVSNGINVIGGSNPITLLAATNSYARMANYSEVRGCISFNISFQHSNGTTCYMTDSTRIEPYWFNESILPSANTTAFNQYSCLGNVTTVDGTDEETSSLITVINSLADIPEFHEWVMIFALSGVAGMFVLGRKIE